MPPRSGQPWADGSRGQHRPALRALSADCTHLKHLAIHTIDAALHAVREEGHYAGVGDTVSGHLGKILEFLLHFLEERYLLVFAAIRPLFCGL